MDDRLKETGRGAYAAIDEMVTALDVDYARLEELREERQAFLDQLAESWSTIERGRISDEFKEWKEAYEDELKELDAASNDCADWEDAQRRIHEDALSIEVRTGWYSIGARPDSFEFNILLTTGGPAVRIMGELDDNREPARAWLEIQDWGTPWTRYYDASQAVLLAYARCFYFGE